MGKERERESRIIIINKKREKEDEEYDRYKEGDEIRRKRTNRQKKRRRNRGTRLPHRHGFKTRSVLFALLGVISSWSEVAPLSGTRKCCLVKRKKKKKMHFELYKVH